MLVSVRERMWYGGGIGERVGVFWGCFFGILHKKCIDSLFVLCVSSREPEDHHAECFLGKGA